MIAGGGDLLAVRGNDLVPTLVKCLNKNGYFVLGKKKYELVRAQKKLGQPAEERLDLLPGRSRLRVYRDLTSNILERELKFDRIYHSLESLADSQ